MIRLTVLIMLLFSAAAYSLTEMDLSLYGEIGEFAVSEGILYASFSGITADSIQRYGILAMDITSGVELWLNDTSGDNHRYNYTPRNLQLHDGRLYAVIHKTGLLCLDSTTGDEEFLWRTEEGIISRYIFEEDIIYVASKIEIAVMDAATGEIFWTFQDELHEIGMHETLIGLYLKAGRLYVGSISSSIRCFDAATGEFIWRANYVVDSGGAGYAHTHYVSGKLVFASSASDELSMLDTGTGRLISFIENFIYKAGDEAGLYVYNWDEKSLCEIDPASGMITDHPGPGTDMDLYSSHFILTDDLICAGSPSGMLWIASRDETVETDEGILLDITDEKIWLTAQDENIYAISEEGLVFSINVRTHDTVEINTMFEADGLIRIEDGTGYFRSGSSLIILNPGDLNSN
jgi:outer membrane protein assembly factor BamB